MPKISRTKEMIEMPAGFVPGPQHVICAKGKQAKEHQANRYLRFLVQSNLQEYSECPTKLERSFIVSNILKTIRQDGGFVRKVGNKWYDVSDRNAREKIGQAFRDSLHTQFKSSTKAKASVRRQQQRQRASLSSSSASSNSSSSGSSSNSSACSTGSNHAIMMMMPRTITPTRAASSTPMTASFPITEVSFSFPTQLPAMSPVTPSPSNFGKPEVELDIFQLQNTTNFEPLPLSQAMVMNFNDSTKSDDASFEQAIDEMFQCQQEEEQEDDLLFPMPMF